MRGVAVAGVAGGGPEGPVPPALVAVTTTEYDVPLSRPGMMMGLDVPVYVAMPDVGVGEMVTV